MDKQESSLRISIIALIISIIALLLNLYVFYLFRSGMHAPQGEPQPQVVQVQQDEPQPQQDDEPVIQPKTGNEDLSVKKKAAAPVYVDLGLPSGTRWRNVNEECGLITYEDAVAQFGKQLPSFKQYTELYEKCDWQELKKGGYKVVGPNGNSIVFPLTGFINCTGEFRGANEFGDYWTSTSNGKEAYRMVFNDKGVKIVPHTPCYQRAIRLVEK